MLCNESVAHFAACIPYAVDGLSCCLHSMQDADEFQSTALQALGNSLRQPGVLQLLLIMPLRLHLPRTCEPLRLL